MGVSQLSDFLSHLRQKLNHTLLARTKRYTRMRQSRFATKRTKPSHYLALWAILAHKQWIGIQDALAMKKGFFYLRPTNNGMECINDRDHGDTTEHGLC